MQRRSDKGFTLLEMVLSLGISGIILAIGVNLWLVSWQAFFHETQQTQALDDEWLLYTALKRDLASSQTVRADGAGLTVALVDGQVARYRLSPTSHLVLRTLNGYGEVAVSTGVAAFHPQIDAAGNLLVAINYGNKGIHYEKKFILSANATAV